MILDHVGFNVRDLESSKSFYAKALAPLGIKQMISGEGWLMFGREKPEFWLGALGNCPGPIHLAFAADNREQVRLFHAAALAAGGKDNGKPGLRDYHPDYYGAFIIDPDGHNIEAVCHKAEA
jgi:catechol 2,3-dioxygenase-like lactoylglutathione lyase family enzyme